MPFSWSNDGTKLLYRGIDVDAMRPLTESEFNRFKGNYDDIPAFQEYLDDEGISESSATFDDFKTWYQDEYQVNYDEAAARFTESTYVDIGIGMKLNEDGEVIPTSAFNSSLNGMEYLGYGEDEDGDSRNLAVLLRELGNIFLDCDAESGAYANVEDAERARVLTLKLQGAMSGMIEQHSKLSASVDYLNTNVDQLTVNKDQLNEQIMDLEEIDAADAITQMLWAQYSYNAALRIGTNILSQSLIDYMN